MAVEDTAQEQAGEEYCEFAFKVPQAPEGATLKVQAPDGCVLKIPLPRNVQVGMKLVMHKNEDTQGQWRIKCAEEGDGPEAAPAAKANAAAPQPQQAAPAPAAAPPAEDKRVTTTAVSKAPASKASLPKENKPRTRTKAELAMDLGGPDVVNVKLDTTKGPIFLKIVPSWAPLGAERFLQLVDGHRACSAPSFPRRAAGVSCLSHH